jgi:large subunit ribosomal protein L13
VDTLSYKTVSANKATVKKEWFVIDAQGLVLGRLASTVARILRGKHKPDFTPHVDGGDNVIVINAEKVILTGRKMKEKEYFRHSGYPGGQYSQTPKDILVKYPERLLEMAVKGMLPKNRLGRSIFKNLKVVVGPDHKHQAQNPVSIDLNTIK